MTNPETGGLVYYLLDATRLTQRVKIGYTTKLTERIANLASETMMWQRPIVLALEPGGIGTERKRHNQFRHLRIMGEWFEYGPELQEHLRQMPHPIGWLRDHPELWHYAGGWQSMTGFVRQHGRAVPVPQTPVDDLIGPEPVEF